MVVKYSITDLKSKLKEFYEGHPLQGCTEEWYGDEAWMISGCVEEFISWLETGSYIVPGNIYEYIE